MLTKTTISTDFAKFEKACMASDVKIQEKTQFTGMAVVVLKFKHPEQLIKLGQLMGMEEVKQEVSVQAVKQTEQEKNAGFDPKDLQADKKSKK